MKRVKAACICQTLHCMLKEDVGHDYAVKLVNQEVEQYKKHLEKNHTQYKIVEQNAQADGSIMSSLVGVYESKTPLSFQNQKGQAERKLLQWIFPLQEPFFTLFSALTPH